jgi:hypothetical protein
VAEHQRRTVDNYLRLVDLAPELPIVSAVQVSGPTFRFIANARLRWN